MVLSLYICFLGLKVFVIILESFNGVGSDLKYGFIDYVVIFF